MTEYTTVNRANWDARVAAHVASPDYEVARFATDPAFVSGVVAFDRARLGDLTGVRGIHLQCHIGTDTVSLCRLGARMTGLDFSVPATEAARVVAAAAGADADFVVADVRDALDVCEPGSFDLVYTGIGALCWLPSIAQWASVVAGLLRPGGRLFVRDGHPMLFALDDEGAEDLVVRFPYFERAAPVEYDSDTSYVETDAVFAVTRCAVWNHGIGELLTAVLGEGMEVTGFVEHDSVPWNALPGLMARADDGEWRLADGPERLACSYTLEAVKIA